MALGKESSEPLTSRQIAKVFSSIAGALVMETPPEEVMAAFEHFVEHKEQYLRIWRETVKIYKEDGKP